MSLRVRINLLITALMVLFALALGRMVLDETRNSIREEIEAGTKVTVQMLGAVVHASELAPTPQPFLLRFLEDLGRVRANHIRLTDTVTQAILYESPPSRYKAGRNAPHWYAQLVRPEIHPVAIELPGARIEVVPDASRSILDAWDDLKGLLALGGLFFVLVNVLVFWFVSRSMRPMETIQQGLGAMGSGRLAVRLPDFRLPEFRRISIAFNRMSEALADAMAENRRLALAVRQSSDAILIHDPDGRIAFWNPAAERMFGYAQGEIIGEPLSMLAPLAHRADADQQLASVLRREPIDNVLTRRLTREGTELDVAISAAPLVDPDTGRVLGGIVSHRDIAPQIRAYAAENELNENHALSAIVRARVEEERRGIAQELHDEWGQCVTAIGTIAESIVRAGDATPELRARATSIKEVAARIYDGMHAIVRRLQPADLDALGLRGTLEAATAAWAERHPDVTFALEMDGNLDKLGEAVDIAVYRLVHEGLTNIVRHAEATRAEVGIRRERADELVVTIRDNGHGHASLATSAVGFGLIGMRTRVEALGGRFAMEGRPGAGTELRACIPLVGAGEEPGAKWAPSK